ncbi:TetR/AcrR family transcriptional regulator [Hyphomicrobium sulfonivorans]|uniref:TetR/AcrR family transcriptional regulator n=1 Tax=Hyphomicrobium sulfonivorans TaxID=121290 RepID=UPI0015712D59|nr:TetR/AcrR family transcriptional regulator [Hyphomicrobium sulfonivorans]MBI1650049.1 TetR/AcrR family transcriptional regulator [Hyphomicrobium sulfonivorans]NSL72967.1 TetR/AcrR family transcriptional regulator [Hyphomicrobium sulfonivorans]
MSNAIDTRTALLAEAETLVRTLGYAAFSYGDLSERVGIRKASIHHHFSTKEVLGNALIENYLERFRAQLVELSASGGGATKQLRTYGDFFSGSLAEGQMPLCGALAADAAYLPPSMQKRVKAFFELHVDWLEMALRNGAASGEITLHAPPKRTALLLLSTLQGASVVAWALKDPGVIKPVFRQLLDSITRKDA